MFSKKSLGILLVMTLAVLAKPEFEVSGDIEFRFRGEMVETTDDTGAVDTSSPKTTYQAYTNKLGWNARLQLILDETFKIKVRLSNPEGYNLETVFENGEFSDFGSIIGLAIPQAELFWSPGVFNMSAGILEVKNSTALTVVRGAEESGYTKNFSYSDDWKKHTNESQVGARIGAKFDIFSVNLTYAVAEHIKQSDTAQPRTDHRFILDAPITLNKDMKMKITPQFTIRTGANQVLHNRTASYHGGVDFSTKVGKIISVKAGAAYGGFYDTPTSDHLNSGFMLMVAPTVKFSIHKVSLGYSFSGGNNAAASSVSQAYNLLDFKWAFKVHKNFSITPRLRAWYNTQSGSDVSYKKLRPELIFKGAF